MSMWILLCVLGIACAKAPPVPAPVPAPAPENAVSARQVDEKVTVVNTTPNPVQVKLSSEGPSRAPAASTFGPIAPGEQASGTISVWTDGSFTIHATWTAADGTEKTSRPFTAVITPTDPITPVTATLKLIGSFGTWSQVVWDPPATP